MHNLTQRIKQHPIYSALILFILLALVFAALGPSLKLSTLYSSYGTNVQGDYIVARNECRAQAEAFVASEYEDIRNKQLVTIFTQCMEARKWEGRNLYSLGWADGCDSGLTAALPLRPLLQKFYKRVEWAANDQYKQGWNEGFSFCRFQQSAWLDLVGLALILFALGATRCRCKSNAP